MNSQTLIHKYTNPYTRTRTHKRTERDSYNKYSVHSYYVSWLLICMNFVPLFIYWAFHFYWATTFSWWYKLVQIIPSQDFGIEFYWADRARLVVDYVFAYFVVALFFFRPFRLACVCVCICIKNLFVDWSWLFQFSRFVRSWPTDTAHICHILYSIWFESDLKNVMHVWFKIGFPLENLILSRAIQFSKKQQQQQQKSRNEKESENADHWNWICVRFFSRSGQPLCERPLFWLSCRIQITYFPTRSTLAYACNVRIYKQAYEFKKKHTPFVCAQNIKQISRQPHRSQWNFELCVNQILIWPQMQTVWFLSISISIS